MDTFHHTLATHFTHMFIPFQGSKTNSDMARDSPPELVSAQKNFRKNCDDLGLLGKACSLPGLSLTFRSPYFLPVEIRSPELQLQVIVHCLI